MSGDAMTMLDLAPAWAEIFVLAAACTILLVDVFLGDRHRWVTYALCMATLAGAAFLTASHAATERVSAFHGMFIADPLADVLKLFTYAMVAVSFLYSREYLVRRGLFKGEYYLLGLFGMLGVMVLISAGSLLTIYLGVELLSLSLYAMVAFDRESGIAAESAMKYFVLGAIASGALLYGMSILYGVT
jgi:NADH-quinone oxidoreductase subunit N